MKKLLHVVAFAEAALGMSAPAWADIAVKDATGATIATCSTTTSSTQVPCHQIKNASGTTINPATIEIQQQMLTALGSPLQAGGNIGNITGTITLPTGAATAAAQGTGNGSLATLAGTVGAVGSPAASAQTIQTAASAPLSVTQAAALPAGTNLIGSVDTVVKATATDRGLIVTTAGTAQQLMAANTARRGFSIQNQSSGACYISGVAAATADYHSLQIPAGQLYETSPTHVGTGAVSIVCAGANASVYAREW